MGKVFSRFQLWAWNSVKFKRDIFTEAAEMGYDPNSQQFKRLQRMMTADLFMLGLASLFPSSMFGAKLPQP